jgi:hypothetical protein
MSVGEAIEIDVLARDLPGAQQPPVVDRTVVITLTTLATEYFQE